MIRAQQRRRQDLRGLVRALPQADNVLATPRQRLDMINMRLGARLHKKLDAHRIVLARLGARLAGQSPHARLARVQENLRNLEGRLRRALAQHHLQKQHKLAQQADRLAAAFNKTIALAGARQQAARDRLGNLSARLAPALAAQLRRRREHLVNLDKLRVSLGYKQVLARGFVLVRDTAGTPIRSADMARSLTRLTIEFADGTLSALPEHGSRSRKSAEPEKSQIPLTKLGPQGSLF